MSARRLTIVSSRSPLVRLGGVAAKAVRYARIAQADGLDVSIVSLDPQSRRTAWPTLTTPDGLALCDVAPAADVPARLALFDALLSRESADGVLALGLSRVGQPAAMAARHWGVPLIAHASGTDVLLDLYDPQWVTSTAWTLSRATVLTAASAEMAEVVRGMRPEAPVALWPESVALDRFFPRPPEEGLAQAFGWPESWLRIGVLDPCPGAGGLEETLTAFSAVRRQRDDAQLVLPARLGQTARELLDGWRRADPLSAGRQVWLPDLDETEMPNVFALWHQVWVPWQRDLGGAGLLQAMACEVPVIATPVGIHSSWLRDGGNALVVPFRDPESLTLASLRLAGDPELGRTLGGAARKEMPADVRPEAEAQRLHRAFEGLGWV